MALANYADLKIAVAKWSRRSDISDIIDDAIDLAESEMFKRLEIRDMEARATASLDDTTPSRFLALPLQFIKMRKMNLITTGTVPDEVVKELEYRNPDGLRVKTGTGIPSFFTITSQLEFDINPDDNYTVEMQYFKNLDSLSPANTTNAVITRFPEIYLNGTLWAIFDSVRNEELAEFRYNKFLSAIESANKKDKKGRYGSAPRMSPRASTP